MKEGWNILKIKDICCKASSNIAQNKIKDNKGSYPIFGASGFIQNIDFYQQEEKYIGIVKDGSGCGRVNLYPAKSSLLGTLQYILPKEGYNLEFIAYALQSLDFSKYIAGAAIPHIYFKDYSEEKILIPNYTEQQRIVDILDKAFEKIDKIKANAEKNLQQAKDLFERTLQECLQPHCELTKCKMGDICNLFQGLAINSKTKHLIVDHSNLPLLRIKDLKENTTSVYVDEEKYPKSSLAQKDDIIYTRTGTLGHVFTGRYGIMHNNCFKIEIDKEKISKGFFMYFIDNEDFRNKITKVAQRAAQPDITHKIFKEQSIEFPTDIAEQQKIVSKLDTLSEKCKKIEANYNRILTECDALKQALLRKAFNGVL